MVPPELKKEAESLLILETLSSEAAVWEILIGSMELSPTLGKKEISSFIHNNKKFWE